MKKWIFKVVFFFVIFAISSVIVFELSFRMADAEFFIRLLNYLSSFGFKPTFDSLVIFLILFFLITSILLYIAFTKTKRNKIK